jgi:hypothetical protein
MHIPETKIETEVIFFQQSMHIPETKLEMEIFFGNKPSQQTKSMNTSS